MNGILVWGRTGLLPSCVLVVWTGFVGGCGGTDDGSPRSPDGPASAARDPQDDEHPTALDLEDAVRRPHRDTRPADIKHPAQEAAPLCPNAGFVVWASPPSRCLVPVCECFGEMMLCGCADALLERGSCSGGSEEVLSGSPPDRIPVDRWDDIGDPVDEYQGSIADPEIAPPPEEEATGHDDSPSDGSGGQREGAGGDGADNQGSGGGGSSGSGGAWGGGGSGAWGSDPSGG